LVHEVARDVDGFKAGDHVAFLSGHAYAEYDVTPAAQATHLPPGLAGVPFPAEALGCAMNVFGRSAIRTGDRVAVIGIGFMGAVLTRFAANAGAKVAAISRRPCALNFAEEFGAESTWPLTDIETRNKVLNWTGGQGFDCVVEAVGKQETLDLAGELAKERGRLVIAGYHQDGLRQVNMQLWNWKGLDVINAHERDPQQYVRGMRAAIDAVISGALDPSPLYTHIYPLQDLSLALEMASTRPDGFLKALVMP
jgi:threonine dehydrogenase-like Zn-dependent dehydrogenase